MLSMNLSNIKRNKSSWVIRTKPRAAGREAQTLPLRNAPSPLICIHVYLIFVFLIAQLRLIVTILSWASNDSCSKIMSAAGLELIISRLCGNLAIRCLDYFFSKRWLLQFNEVSNLFFSTRFGIFHFIYSGPDLQRKYKYSKTIYKSTQHTRNGLALIQFFSLLLPNSAN